MCEGWVPTYSMVSATDSYKALASMRGSEAVLMRGAPLLGGTPQAWSLAHLVICPLLPTTSSDDMSHSMPSVGRLAARQ